ncbi:hypothetical protein RvY_05614-2 [Ramazzottius varieornatus]|nr:hypothetical protein RvY_05614-2 [Ramazzottius varieornatus]
MLLHSDLYEECLDYLEGHFPRSLPIYHLMYGITHQRLAWPYVNFVVDRWPNPEVVLCRPTQVHAPEPGELDTSVRQICYTVSLWSINAEELEKILKDPTVLNWDREIMFHGVACPSDRDVVEKVCNLSGRHYLTESSDCCEVSMMTPKTLREIPLIIPPGFRVGSLRPCHAAQVNEEWSYGGNDSTMKYLEVALDIFPSAAVFDTSDRPVSYMIYEPEGCMAMGYTNPAFRKRGFFSVVNYLLARHLFRIGLKQVYVQVIHTNHASKNAYLKLGAEVVPGWRQHWILYRPSHMSQDSPGAVCLPDMRSDE